MALRLDIRHLQRPRMVRKGPPGGVLPGNQHNRRWLGICERTLRRYMQADRIRFHRLPGGHCRIPEDAIEEFWTEHDRRRTRAAGGSVDTRRAAKARRPSPRSSAGRRPALGSEPPEDYDLSPAALQRLRTQLR